MPFRLFITFFFISIYLFSCSSSNCSKTCPYANMACYQNNCVCKPGWEGLKCDSITANRYIGLYKVVGSCITTDHLCQIIRASASLTDVDRVEITNFLNLGISVFGYIDNTNVSIPNQFQDSYNISGDGYYETKTKNFNFSVQYFDFTNQKTCTLTFIKQ